MECKRCGNSNPDYFYEGHKGIYCRKCVGFKRLLVEEELNPFLYEVNNEDYDYDLGFNLTSYQEKVSNDCLKHLLLGENILLKCVCGSGKTEIMVKSIAEYIKQGKKVCYAIPRKEVVIELEERFKRIFAKTKVTSIYGGHINDLTGDLIICTTHQLFRFYQTFDLLIIDEADGYPLNGNKELMNIALKACKGQIVFSTATTNIFLDEYIKNINCFSLSLNVRPSLNPLAVPKTYYGPKFILLILLWIKLHSMTNQCIIFVPSKKMCKNVYLFLKVFYKATYTYADLAKRSENIKAFKEKEYDIIVSTTVLERGITIKDVNVIILDTNKTFVKENIIQMAGRVGRNILNPSGEVTILSNHLDREVISAIKEIKEANNALSLLR